MLRPFLDVFWDEKVWLPPNTTWADVAPGPDKAVAYTNHWHVLYPIPMALVYTAIRFTMENYVFAPFGRSLGVKEGRSKKVPNNPKLETAYRADPESKKIIGLAKQLDMTERQVERWWRLRRSQDKPSKLVKFCENMWKSAFLTYNFLCGVYILWDKEWLWDIDHCYIGHPHQGYTNGMWWYYMVTSAFYWSLLLSQFWDVRRKDFWQNFVHHLATISLISFSWVLNAHRVGTLVILSHDPAEIFLEAAKASKYAGYHKVCNCIFALFVLLWTVTRLGIYPFYIIWSLLFRAPKLWSPILTFDVLIFLLCVLFALDVLWTWLILQVLYKSIKTGQVKGDIRSSSSEVSDSENSHDSNHNTPNRVNNNMSDK
ncbi:ceramide synthase 5-like [Choristoneura fumiferana]|uniref:ceramide synthase 5-like n=1 Tax=Choristoneura fumiferana TaxID=7141 RepID=UPI003D15B65D